MCDGGEGRRQSLDLGSEGREKRGDDGGGSSDTRRREVKELYIKENFGVSRFICLEGTLE